jgi:ribosomal protein S18 acetylase RimI-like enzyme
MHANIRRATSADLAPLGRLGASLMRTHYELDRLRFLKPAAESAVGYAGFLGSMLDEPESVVFVAETDRGEIVGYVFAALEPLSWKELRGPAGFIHDLLVAEPACRGGIGTELMHAAIAWLREQGAPRVLLGTAAQNAPAQALFKRLGFRETMIEMTLEL